MVWLPKTVNEIRSTEKSCVILPFLGWPVHNILKKIKLPRILLCFSCLLSCPSCLLCLLSCFRRRCHPSSVSSYISSVVCPLYPHTDQMILQCRGSYRSSRRSRRRSGL